MIFGVALLAGCMLVGSFIGNVLGYLIGLNSDVGGVGFAMLLLLIIVNSEKISSKLPKGSAEGLTFWKEMFIPIIIAMTSAQNVYHAMSSGALAIVAGLVAVAAAFALVPVISLLTKNKDAGEKEEQ